MCISKEGENKQESTIGVLREKCALRVISIGGQRSTEGIGLLN